MRKIFMALAGLTGIVACKSEIELMPNVPGAVASVAIVPGSVSLPKGKTFQLNAVARDAAGGVLTGRAISWSTINPSIAQVSSTGVLSGIAAGRTNVRATVEAMAVEAAADITLLPVTSVAVAPVATTIGVGATAQFSATLRDADGTVLTDRSVTWTTSNANVGTVTATGFVTAVGPGTAQITATSETRTASAALTVSASSPVPVASVTVALGSSALTAGQTTQATVTLRDAGGVVLTGRAIAYSSSNTAVAAVSSTGVVSAVAAGTANIIATSESRTGSAALTVNPASAAPVSSVAVTLNAPNLNPGQTTQANVTLRDASGNVLTGRSVSWTSSNTSVATVSGSGLVTAVAVGTALIRATSETITGSATLTVSAVPPPAPVATVAVTLASSSLTVGQSTQATATLRDAAGNVLTGRTIAWSSTNTAVATVSASGVVSTLAAGTTSIRAVSETITGGANLTVSTPPVGGGVPLVFASDFTTGLGNSYSVLSDANKTPHWSDVSPDADQLYVVNAAGLGFPSTLTNVMRVRYMGVNSADVRAINQWTVPAVGGSVYYRLYYRLDVPNSYGNLSHGGHHPIEAQPGACPFEWEMRIASNSNGTMYWNFTINDDYIMTLNKFQVYRLEWAFKNRTSTNGYKVEIRMYDAAGNLVGDNNNFMRRNTNISLATDNPTITISPECVTALLVGSNGPSGWESVGTTTADAFLYFSGVAVSTSGWPGPYVPGEHR